MMEFWKILSLLSFMVYAQCALPEIEDESVNDETKVQDELPTMDNQDETMELENQDEETDHNMKESQGEAGNDEDALFFLKKKKYFFKHISSHKFNKCSNIYCKKRCIHTYEGEHICNRDCFKDCQTCTTECRQKCYTYRKLIVFKKTKCYKTECHTSCGPTFKVPVTLYPGK